MHPPFFALAFLNDSKAFLLMVFFFAASIFVHELGHFLAAIWRGLKVTRFSIGFGPVLWSKTYKGVQYCICALPLGGYVALPELGHIEAIEGKAEEPREKRKISWTSKVIVLVAGAVFNVLFALGLATILYFAGIPDASAKNTTQVGYVPPQLKLSTGVEIPNPAWEAGLKRGDTILEVDGQSVEKWQDVEVYIAVGVQHNEDGKASSTLLVDRNGKELELTLLPARISDDFKRFGGMFPVIEPVVKNVVPGFPAAVTGIRPGDEFIEVNGEPVVTAMQLSEAISANPEGPIQLKVLRKKDDANETFDVALSPKYNPTYEMNMIGVDWGRVHYIKGVSPFKQVYSVVKLTFITLSRMVHPQSDVGLSDATGVVGMGKIMYDSAKTGMRHILFIVILINVNLAILNLLPVPVLDGGHIVFATLEKLRGKPVPQNLMMTLQGTFILLLLTFMVFVSINDVKRFFLSSEPAAQEERQEEAPNPPMEPDQQDLTAEKPNP